MNTLRLLLITVTMVLWSLFPVAGSQARQTGLGQILRQSGIPEVPSTCPAPGWTMPRDLAGGFADARFTQVAVDLDGAAHVVWSGRQGTLGSAVYYAKLHPYRDQQRQHDEMEGPVPLSNPTHIAAQPRIVVDVWGNVHVVWEDLVSPSSRGEIFYARRDKWADNWMPGESDRENVSNTSGWSEVAQIQVDPYGVVHVVWVEHMGTESHLFYAHKSGADEEWLSEDLTASLGATINAVAAVPAYDPIASFSRTFHLVWVSDDEDVVYASRNRFGVWETERVARTPGMSTDPALVINSSGTPQVVWSDETPGQADIYFAYRTPFGNWLTQNISNSAQDSRVPQLALDGQDWPYAVWAEEGEIFFTRRDGSGNWLTPENISRTSGYSSDPHVAVSYWGDTHVTWEDDGIYYNRRGSFGDWPTAVRVDCTVDNTWQLDAALDSLGRVHAVWIGTGNGNDKVLVSRTSLDPSYQPSADSFNFGNEPSTREWDMFRQFFGREAVEFPNGAHRPLAQRFFEEKYEKDIGGGSCVGVSAGSAFHYWRAEQRFAGDYRIPRPGQGFWARLIDASRDEVWSSVSYYHGAQKSREVEEEYGMVHK